MCGFAGVVGNFEQNEDLYIQSNNLKHRGPDESSSYRDNNIHIDFFRLSIIDHKGVLNQKYLRIKIMYYSLMAKFITLKTYKKI